MEDRISARELRDMGFEITDTIPDEATTSRAGLQLIVGKCSMDGDVFSTTIETSGALVFEWKDLR